MKDYKFDLALSNYRSLTGDYDTQFESVEDIYVAIQNAVDNDGDATIIQPLTTDITENGTYEFKKQCEIDAYEPVTINVNIDNEAVYNQGYSDGFDSGIIDQKSKLEDIEITSNGTYFKEDGYKNVTVKIPAELDFGVIGYDSELSKELNGDFQADIDHSKSLYDKYNGVLSGDVSKLFENDVNLVYCPNFDTSNVTSMSSMFNGCTNLQIIPLLNTSNVTSMGGTFWGCTNLQTIPQLDTSNVTSMPSMFNGCTNLQTIPLLNTSKVTIMNYMFENCTNLQTIPLLNTSKVTSMSGAFSDCTNLQTIPQLDTSSVTSMNSVFRGCDNLKSIPLLDTGNVTDAPYLLYSCKSLTDVGGFKDFGKYEGMSTGSMFGLTTNLTHDSVMNIINNLYDRAAAGYKTVTLPLGSKNLARISDDEKAIATNKGWTLS